jgi:hypothetical protein
MPLEPLKEAGLGCVYLCLCLPDHDRYQPISLSVVHEAVLRCNGTSALVLGSKCSCLQYTNPASLLNPYVLLCRPLCP